MLQDIESGFLEEGGDLAEIFAAPDATQAGRFSKDGPAVLARLGVDDVVPVGNTPAGQQGIAAQLDAFGMGVIGQILHPRDVDGILVFHVQSAPEAEDDHFEADGRALVDGGPDHGRLDRFKM